MGLSMSGSNHVQKIEKQSVLKKSRIKSEVLYRTAEPKQTEAKHFTWS